MASTDHTGLRSQYHHYVPRFMLKKWQVEYQRPQNPSRKDGKGGRRKKLGPTRNEHSLNMYDYHTDTLHLGTPIASAFGNRDLYKDDEDAANVYHIEQLFSKLESQAAQILEKLDSAVMMSRRTVGNSVSLTRKQVNTLRKFLWLLPYRSERHANQFLEGNFDSATCRSVDDFRRKHALKDIYAVWLFNLRNILESEHWEIATNENILQADREAYMEEAQHRQLAFFVAPTGFEFILTNNSLGLWEGTKLPSISLWARLLSPGSNPGHASWVHTTTYPVSPRLLIMLRSTAMTVGHRTSVSILGRRIPDNSYFKDFPRTAANVKYIPPLHPTKLARMDMKEIGCRVNDILTFRIHMLDEEQALRVNALRLENTPRWIMFKSLHKLLDYIQYYEQNEGTQGAGPIVGGPAYYSKRTYDSLARQLEFIEFGVSRQFPAFVPLPFGIPTGTSFELQNETYMPMRLDSNGIHDIEEDMQRAEVTRESWRYEIERDYLDHSGGRSSENHLPENAAVTPRHRRSPWTVGSFNPALIFVATFAFIMFMLRSDLGRRSTGELILFYVVDFIISSVMLLLGSCLGTCCRRT